MKKIIVTATLAFFAVGLFAQSSGSSSGSSGSGISSKKGEMYLPESGDWAVSFDATPFLKYFGGFLSSGGATPPTANFVNSSNTLIGKYYVDETTAYRGILRIGIGSSSQDHIINSTSVVATPVFPPSTVTDNMSMSSHLVALGGGMEKRKGKTRLQGYYGAELMFWLAGTSTKYKYGNSYDKVNDATPGWWNFSSNSAGSGLPRNTEVAQGSTFGISLLGFVGFEYFFMPKISVGAEYTWGLTFSSTGQGSTSTEELNPISGADQTDTYKTGGSSNFSLDDGVNSIFGNAEASFLSQSSASLNITFHF